jgi:hypothetical protein
MKNLLETSRVATAVAQALGRNSRIFGYALLAGTGSMSALAQTPPAPAAAQDEPIDEVVVTGLRKSIQDSIGVKKLDSSIVEVVSAEDIGKLPDSSIAESIARLPGIAAQRTGHDQRQPHGGVRSVPLRARHAGQDLQDP